MFFDSVIFDLDNTLYNYDVCNDNALDVVINHIYNISGVDKEIIKLEYKKVSISLKQEIGNVGSSHNRFIYFKNLSNRLNLKLNIKEINQLYWDSFYSKIILNDGVIDLLNFFKENNIKLFILTDYTLEEQYSKLSKLNIVDFFNDIISSEEIGIDKPSNKMFLSAKEKAKSDNIIMIGDNFDKDIMGADSLGIYSFHYCENKKISINKKYLEFGSFVELLNLLKDIKVEIDNLVDISNYFGQRFDLVQGAGGNISVKVDDLMIIKSSGIKMHKLSSSSGYSILNNIELKNDVINNEYNNIDNYNLFINKRASMETYMHSLLKKYTVHLHPIQTNYILVRDNFKEKISSLFPKSSIIDYTTPGIPLSIEIAKHINSELFFLANHGIIYTTNNFDEIKSKIEEVISICELNININLSRYKLVNNISDTIGKLTGKRMTTILVNDNLVNNYFNQNKKISFLFPDSVIFCGKEILVTNDINDLLEFHQIHKDYPRIINYNGQIYICDLSIEKCYDILDIVKSQILLLEGNSGMRFLEKDEQEILLSLDSEKYRKKIK